MRAKCAGDHLIPRVVRRIVAHEPEDLDRRRLLGEIAHRNVEVLGPAHPLPRRFAQHVAVLEDVLERLLQLAGRLDPLLHGLVAQRRPKTVSQLDPPRATVGTGVAPDAHPQRRTGEDAIEVARPGLQDDLARGNSMASPRGQLPLHMPHWMHPSAGSPSTTCLRNCVPCSNLSVAVAIAFLRVRCLPTAASSTNSVAALLAMSVPLAAIHAVDRLKPFWDKELRVNP